MRKVSDAELKLRGTFRRSLHPERFPPLSRPDRPHLLTPAKLDALLIDPRGRLSPMDALMRWQTRGPHVIARYADAHPGKRPFMFWRCDAPNEPRRQVGGIGEPLPFANNVRVYCECGIPKDWLRVNIDDPPRFEAQCTFLARFGLLLGGEIERLTLADQKPEELPTEFWPRDETTYASHD